MVWPKLIDYSDQECKLMLRRLGERIVIVWRFIRKQNRADYYGQFNCWFLFFLLLSQNLKPILLWLAL